MSKRKDAKLVICNLQKTPYDSNADILIHTKTDNLMIQLMNKLGLEIPDIEFKFDLQVNLNQKGSFELVNSSVNLKMLLKGCWMITSANNIVPMGPKDNFKTQVLTYKQDKGLRIKFDF